jgi:acyl-CoA reductase-like NAD-dependent aldehyde dehydrogenase
MDKTDLSSIPEIVSNSRAAQSSWNTIPPKQRASIIEQVKETLINRADEVIELICRETGKHRFEALAFEVLPAVNLVSHFSKRTRKLLKKKSLNLRLFKHRSSRIEFSPCGVVAVLSSSASPFYSCFSDIVMALLAGNTVVFKPSEKAAQVAQKIQDLFDEAGLPQHVLQTIFGGDDAGLAILEQQVDKVFYTGKQDTAEDLLKKTSAHGIPACFQIDTSAVMIVLGDADTKFAASAFVWGTLHNGGRPGTTAVSRMFVHESLHEKLCGHIKEKFLSSGMDTSSKDLATLVIPFKSLLEAVAKANTEGDGVSACVFTRNFAHGIQVARQLAAATVSINEVSYTSLLPETPWGHFKKPIFGKKRSDDGFYEFVKAKHIHIPRSRLFVFRSPWWLPYTEFQFAAARKLLDVYRRHWTDKLKTIPLFLWDLANFLKHEKRL